MYEEDVSRCEKKIANKPFYGTLKSNKLLRRFCLDAFSMLTL